MLHIKLKIYVTNIELLISSEFANGLDPTQFNLEASHVIAYVTKSLTIKTSAPYPKTEINIWLYD